MATGDFDGVVRLWDLERGESLPDPLQAFPDSWAQISRKVLPTGSPDHSVLRKAIPGK